MRDPIFGEEFVHVEWHRLGFRYAHVASASALTFLGLPIYRRVGTIKRWF